jgi:hypothetical protein
MSVKTEENMKELLLLLFGMETSENALLLYSVVRRL